MRLSKLMRATFSESTTMAKSAVTDSVYRLYSIPDSAVPVSDIPSATFLQEQELLDIAGWDYEYDDATAEELDKLSESDYADLLDICGYFGVSETEVLRLRHMGYTYDEIEEYLFASDDEDGFYDFCGEL